MTWAEYLALPCAQQKSVTVINQLDALPLPNSTGQAREPGQAASDQCNNTGGVRQALPGSSSSGENTMSKEDNCGHPILETIGKMAVRIRELERERNEAREIATHLMQHSVTCWSYQAELLEAYPWMRRG